MEPDLAKLFARALGEDDDTDTETDRRILDAALVEVGARGAKGTTVDLVAERAGVGRVTVFRRFGSKDAMVERLTMRELRTFLAEVEQVTGQLRDPVERIAEGFVMCVQAGTRHPLVERAAREDPGTFLEHLRTGKPSPIDLAIAFVADDIARGRRRSGLDGERSEEIAALLVRLGLAYILVPDDALRDPEQARRFARRTLAPIALAD